MLKGQTRGRLVLWSRASLCLLAAGVAAPAVSFAQQNDANLTAPLNTLNDAQKTYAGVLGTVSEMPMSGFAAREKAAQALAQIRSGVLQVRTSDKVPQDLLHNTLTAIDEAQTALKTNSAQTIAWSLQTVSQEIQALQTTLTGQNPPQTASAERQTGVAPRSPETPNSKAEIRVRDERGQSGPMQQAAPERPMEKTAQAPAQPAQQPVGPKQADTAANQPAQQAAPERPMEKTAQAPAQPAQQPASPKQADTAAIQPAQLTALANMKRDDIVGKWLADKNGNDVARIADLKTSADGKIQAAEIDLGGFLGIGSRRVAVPVDGLQLKGDRIEATSMTADQIRNLEAK